MAVVWVPPLLQKHTGGAERVRVEGATLRQVVTNLCARYPGMRPRLLTEDGQLQSGMAVAIDGETNHLGLLEPVRDDAEVHFIPAISGG